MSSTILSGVMHYIQKICQPGDAAFYTAHRSQAKLYSKLHCCMSEGFCIASVCQAVSCSMQEPFMGVLNFAQISSWRTTLLCHNASSSRPVSSCVACESASVVYHV